MRDLEYERERDRERDEQRRRREAEEIKKRKEREAKLRQLEKERMERERKLREKAEETIREQAKKMGWLLKEFQFHPGSFHMYRPGTKDKFKIEVLETGVVRVDMRGIAISPQNHPSVDAFMANLRDTLKGVWTTVARGRMPAAAHGHAHTHDHAHTHTH